MPRIIDATTSAPMSPRWVRLSPALIISRAMIVSARSIPTKAILGKDQVAAMNTSELTSEGFRSQSS